MHYARCGGIFDVHLTANLPRNLPVKKIVKSVKNWQNVVMSLWPCFLAHPVYRNRSSRPGGCRTIHLTNRNSYVHVISTFVNVKWTETQVEKCIHCGPLIVRKTRKSDATRCQILRIKCIRFDFRGGSAPDPAGRAYNAPPDPLAVFKGPTFKAE